MPIQAPCHKRGEPDCPDRHVGCQADCEKYLAFKKEREAVYAKRQTSLMMCEYYDVSIYRHRQKLKYSETGRRALAQR